MDTQFSLDQNYDFKIKGIFEKLSYDRGIYESVDDSSLS